MSLANTPMVVISRPMPQQPRRRPTHPRPTDRQKRYGMIFPTNALHGVFEDDDDESTWSMSRSRSSRRMPTSRVATVCTRNSSPAQEIAARYRASHSGDDRSRTRASSSVTYLDVPSTDGLSMGTSMESVLSSLSGPRVRVRESRADAIDDAAREAYVMAIRWGVDANIPCQRPGCRDILPNIRGLATHLTLHDIEPADRYARAAPYGSFLDFGHSVGGRQQWRYPPSSAPYARSARRRSKLRKYLSMLTCCCIGCHAPHDDFF
ncbi:hypothetical protein C8Q77DRAFT_1051611 [Trametes polyzona]|nr:hypothetical protein C8Q77DRAFT_1051611 [Trametes polyzona]